MGGITVAVSHEVYYKDKWTLEGWIKQNAPHLPNMVYPFGKAM